MAARLTDKQKKKIIADRADGLSIRQLANKYHTSTTTIHRTLKSDPETEQKVTQKKEENTADILAYMESKKSVVCNIIGIGLDVLCDPEKLKTANPSQITTALGTLIVKWVMVNGSSGTEAKEDGLSASLRELAKELESE
jgi:IS30 family transposase